MNVDVFGPPYGLDLYETVPTPSNVECALWACIQVYNTTVKSTVQHQTIAAVYDTIHYQEGLLVDGTIKFPHLPADMDPANETNFSASVLPYVQLRNYLLPVMNGTSYLTHTDGQIYTSDLVRGIWNGTTDMDSWISNLATSMTNVIRSTNTSSRPQYNGTPYELMVIVRWKWIVLPAALVAMSILFLIAVIIRTAYSPVQSWKGNLLTMFLFELDEDIKDAAVDQVDKYRGLDKAIGRKRVRSTKERSGVWKLKEA